MLFINHYVSLCDMLFMYHYVSLHIGHVLLSLKATELQGFKHFKKFLFLK